MVAGRARRRDRHDAAVATTAGNRHRDAVVFGECENQVGCCTESGNTSTTNEILLRVVLILILNDDDDEEALVGEKDGEPALAAPRWMISEEANKFQLSY